MRNELFLPSDQTDRRTRFEVQRARFDIRRGGGVNPLSASIGERARVRCRSELPAPCPSLPLCPFPIAGFSHYDGARALPELREGTSLTLRPEPGNPHDMHAVEILHGQVKLGYVPRFCNRHVSHMLAEGMPLGCEIERVDPNSPPWEAVSVRLSIADATPLRLDRGEGQGEVSIRLLAPSS